MKKRLKTLYVVKLLSGEYGMIVRTTMGKYICVKGTYLPLKDYLGDLTYIDPYSREMDIVEIWGHSLYQDNALTVTIEGRPLLWAA